MTTFYYYSVNHQSGLQRNTFSKLSYIFFNTSKCATDYVISFEVLIWWFHRSKDFEAIKSVKLAIRPWLSCRYNKNTLVDLLSFVRFKGIFLYMDFQAAVILSVFWLFLKWYGRAVSIVARWKVSSHILWEMIDFLGYSSRH